MDSILKIQLYRNTFSFYFLATLVSWVLWFIAAWLSHHTPASYLNLVSIFGILGLLSPLIVALAFIYPKKELRRDCAVRIFGLKAVAIKYFVIAVLLMPASILLAQFVSLLFGYSPEQFQFRDGFTFTSGVLPVWFLMVMAPIIEELAWHSYGTDSLRGRFSLLTTSLIFAFFWGIWHLPLSFIKDYYHSNLLESGAIYSLNFFLSLFPFVLIMNWLYYKTNRSILITIIFHISAGYFNEIFMTHPMSKVIQTVLLTLFSFYLILKQKSSFINN